MQKYTFTVVGGGTAGWLTALFLQHYYPFTKINVISSDEIGILGAGEGTTPNTLGMLETLGIPLPELIKKTNATIKNGIKFSNWNGDGESYFHPFVNSDNYNPYAHPNPTGNALPVMPLLWMSAGNKNLNGILIDSHLSEKNQVKYAYNLNSSIKTNPVMDHFNKIGAHSIHFDANILAEHLKWHASMRGINHIEGEIVTINQDENENIKSFTLKDGSEIETNFVFDCSGFKRLIIGNLYKSEWISYSKHLPMKRAIGFFKEHEDPTQIPPETESRAMKAGWAWHIPVQNRIGCGYVFDTDYITDEEAKEEAKEVFGENIKFGKTFNFEAGTFKTPWVKNCIAVGLAGGFIEPLEATSIMITIMTLNGYLENNIGAKGEQFFIDRFNKMMVDVNKENMEFIYLHYLTQRNDTPFWKEFREKNPMPERIEKLFEYMKYTMPDNEFLREGKPNMIYTLSSWYSVLAGTGNINVEIAEKTLGAIQSDSRRELFDRHNHQIWKNIQLTKDVFLDHYKFIQYIKEN